MLISVCVRVCVFVCVCVCVCVCSCVRVRVSCDAITLSIFVLFQTGRAKNLVLLVQDFSKIIIVYTVDFIFC